MQLAATARLLVLLGRGNAGAMHRLMEWLLLLMMINVMIRELCQKLFGSTKNKPWV